MIYCMSDIHGELDRWQKMLELIRFSRDDTLYVLGDVIDRKPHGLEILRDIMDRPNVHLIRGNHEQMMLDSFWGADPQEARRIWKNNGGGRTYQAMAYKLTKEERLRILRYIRRLPDALEVTVNGREFYLVHGYVGEQRHDRLWGRPEPPPKTPPIPGRTVICGHTCTLYLFRYETGYDENAPLRIYHAPGFMDIDAGCGNNTDLRRLACLRLDDLAEFYI